VDRQRFSSEGIYQSDSASVAPRGGDLSPSHDQKSSNGEQSKTGSLRRTGSGLKFSHFASIDSADVLKAATADLVRIFQLQVSVDVYVEYLHRLSYRMSHCSRVVFS